MKKDLRKFDPAVVADLDLQMWQAYYAHDFFKLFSLLVHLLRYQFGLGYMKSFIVGYHGAIAATDFRLKKGHEDRKRPLRHLTSFYKIIAQNSLTPFDYEKAAQLELEWWFVDRYPERYQTSRETALANAMAVVYGINPVMLIPYATYRAQAMVLHDDATAAKTETDWERVGSLLKLSFESLHQAVQG